jgi:hypothetical protein
MALEGAAIVLMLTERPPHPSLRADLSPKGRGEERLHPERLSPPLPLGERSAERSGGGARGPCGVRRARGSLIRRFAPSSPRREEEKRLELKRQ